MRSKYTDRVSNISQYVFNVFNGDFVYSKGLSSDARYGERCAIVGFGTTLSIYIGIHHTYRNIGNTLSWVFLHSIRP